MSQKKQCGKRALCLATGSLVSLGNRSLNISGSLSLHWTTWLGRWDWEQPLWTQQGGTWAQPCLQLVFNAILCSWASPPNCRFLRVMNVHCTIATSWEAAVERSERKQK